MTTHPHPLPNAVHAAPSPTAVDDLSPFDVGAALVTSDARPCRRAAPARHAHAVFTFYTGGSAVLDQRGRWPVAEGDVAIIPAGEGHRVEADRPLEYWGVAFGPAGLAADGLASLLAPFERVRRGAAPVVHVPAERRPFFVSLLRELQGLSRAAPRAVDAAVPRSLLTLALHEVARAGAAAGADAAREGGVVAEALDYIERNCLRPLTLGEVARAVRRSPAHVTTALSRATGRSAVAWIVAGRMAEARRRLAGSDERVDVIAERVGYADVTHFIRTFRRAHGATPAAWRASRARG